jgi:hypothetical protein
MTKRATPATGAEPIRQAEIMGIGPRIAARLEHAGITTVPELSRSEPAALAAALRPAFPQWKAETLQERVEQWIDAARALDASTSPEPSGTHEFVVVLWTDAAGRVTRSRIEHRAGADPAAGPTAIELDGWSPLALAQFVEAAAQLSGVPELSDSGRILTEWSGEAVAAQLVRGSGELVAVRIVLEVEPPQEGGTTHWRIVGRLVPFGPGHPIALGTRRGAVHEGETIELGFSPVVTPPGLYRVWLDVSLMPSGGSVSVVETASIAESTRERAIPA